MSIDLTTLEVEVHDGVCAYAVRWTPNLVSAPNRILCVSIALEVHGGNETGALCRCSRSQRIKPRSSCGVWNTFRVVLTDPWPGGGTMGTSSASSRQSATAHDIAMLRTAFAWIKRRRTGSRRYR
jgi:hypothetical protein